MNSTKSEQLELGTPAFPHPSRIKIRLSAGGPAKAEKSRLASLWFAPMRHLVDTAPDWLPAPSPRRTLPEGRTADQHQLAA